jgi:hypothetical protein
MRLLAAVVLCLAVASSTFAQSATRQKESLRKTGTIKLWAGLGAIAVGAIIAVDSHQSASSTVPGIGTFTASATNTGELVTGLVIAAGGGYLVCDGLNDRKEAEVMKSTRFMMTPEPRGFGAFVRKTW